MEVREQVSTYRLFLTLAKWGSLAIAVLLVFLTLWFHPGGSFMVALTGAVVRDQLREVVALGGRILGVAAHVEVQARPATGEDIGGPAEAHDGLEQFTCGMVSVQRRYAASC